MSAPLTDAELDAAARNSPEYQSARRSCVRPDGTPVPGWWIARARLTALREGRWSAAFAYGDELRERAAREEAQAPETDDEEEW